MRLIFLILFFSCNLFSNDNLWIPSPSFDGINRYLHEDQHPGIFCRTRNGILPNQLILAVYGNCNGEDAPLFYVPYKSIENGISLLALDEDLRRELEEAAKRIANVILAGDLNNENALKDLETIKSHPCYAEFASLVDNVLAGSFQLEYDAANEFVDFVNDNWRKRYFFRTNLVYQTTFVARNTFAIPTNADFLHEDSANSIRGLANLRINLNFKPNPQDYVAQRGQNPVLVSEDQLRAILDECVWLIREGRYNEQIHNQFMSQIFGVENLSAIRSYRNPYAIRFNALKEFFSPVRGDLIEIVSEDIQNLTLGVGWKNGICCLVFNNGEGELRVRVPLLTNVEHIRFISKFDHLFGNIVPKIAFNFSRDDSTDTLYHPSLIPNVEATDSGIQLRFSCNHLISPEALELFVWRQGANCFSHIADPSVSSFLGRLAILCPECSQGTVSFSSIYTCSDEVKERAKTWAAETLSVRGQPRPCGCPRIEERAKKIKNAQENSN